MPSPNRTPGVVIVSWDVPTHRLMEHFEWNGLTYSGAGARVFVVTDRRHELPDYASCVIFRQERFPATKAGPIFSLTMTKNAGIRAAIGCGCNPVIASDVDMWFPPMGWRGLVEVEPGQAIVPLYLMSLSDHPANALERYERADRAEGTVSMWADDWIKAGGYDEAQRGYGGDDGCVVKRIRNAGIEVFRHHRIVHMAHVPGTPQVEFDQQNPRTDHWNRKSGFNPENFHHNARVQTVVNHENDLLRGWSRDEGKAKA